MTQTTTWKRGVRELAAESSGEVGIYIGIGGECCESTVPHHPAVEALSTLQKKETIQQYTQIGVLLPS